MREEKKKIWTERRVNAAKQKRIRRWKTARTKKELWNMKKFKQRKRQNEYRIRWCKRVYKQCRSRRQSASFQHKWPFGRRWNGNFASFHRFFGGIFFCITTITVVYESEHEPSAPTLFCWQSLELLYQPQMVILQCKSTQVYPNKDCSRTEWQANCQTADWMWHHRVLCAFFRRTFAAMCVFLTTSVYFQLWTWYF